MQENKVVGVPIVLILLCPTKASVIIAPKKGEDERERERLRGFAGVDSQREKTARNVNVARTFTPDGWRAQKTKAGGAPMSQKRTAKGA